MRPILLGLVLLGPLGATGCSYYQTAKGIEAGVIEPAVDQAYDETVLRLCRLPLDVQLRALDRHGRDALDGLLGLCPEWRALQGHLLRTVGP